MSKLGDFVGRQSFAWQKQIAAQRLDQARRDAGTDFAMPGMIKTIANGPEHIARFVAFANGLGKETPEADALVDQYRTSIYHRAIAAAVAHGKHKVAIRLHNEIKDQLKGTDATLLGKIAEAARQALVAKDYTKQFVPPSPETATVEDIAQAQRVATDQNNGDWKDDDAQRATNQHDIDVRFGQAKQEAAKEQAATDEAVVQWLTTPTADGKPQTARPPLGLWVRLSPDDQSRVDTALKDNAEGIPTRDRDVMNAQSILPFFARPPTAPQPRFQVPIPRQSGKQGAKDTPSWARGQKPYVDETPEQAATRVMNWRYGKDGWSRKTHDHEFTKLQKYFSRHFRNPAPPPVYESPFGIPGEDRVV